ncbi:MAG: DUF3576 domain-containing protein [Holosporales bacterium]|nr:DUF3576 domain-containing protein [Holosporales bacterium]
MDMFGFMPIRNASPQTGCIRTDWYTAPETPQMRIRMTVQIRGQVLRADAVTVHVHRQKFERNAWIEYPLPAKECTKLEVLVVDKARRLLRECPSS